MKLAYSKYNGLGNDFILINGEIPFEGYNWSEQAIHLCDRNASIGADGLIVASISECASLKMVVFNADGSIAEMCGNGIRCLAVYALENKLVSTRAFSIETGAGIRSVIINDDTSVTVDMGAPILQRSQIPMTGSDNDKVINYPLEIEGKPYLFTAVSLGNPHAVIFDVSLDTVSLSQLGPYIECHSLFPNRINIEFVHVDAPDHATIRVWERGVGETKACGTGACAVVVAGVLAERLNRKTTITLPGGDLKIYWCEETDHVWMTGPVTFEYSSMTTL
jgi:diaminopimelate epimerase